MSTVTESERERVERAQRIAERLDPFLERYPVQRDIRCRYFSAGRNGPRFGWTTEREDGWFLSFRMGSRGLSGERRHRKRKDAKARALHLYEQHQAKEKP